MTGLYAFSGFPQKLCTHNHNNIAFLLFIKWRCKIEPGKNEMTFIFLYMIYTIEKRKIFFTEIEKQITNNYNLLSKKYSDQ